MNIIKRICAERQAIRLHIEVMQVTKENLKRRARNADPMVFNTARAAAKRLQDKIDKAKVELGILESRWKF